MHRRSTRRPGKSRPLFAWLVAVSGCSAVDDFERFQFGGDAGTVTSDAAPDAGDPCAAVVCAEPLVCIRGTCQGRVRTGSDATWKVIAAPASTEWTAPEYDDSAWQGATAMGPSNISPWSLVQGIPSGSAARWIWLGDGRRLPLGDMSAIAARGRISRPYRRVNITVTADDDWRLWVDGRMVGEGTLFAGARAYELDLAPTVTHVVAVEGRNRASVAGVIVDVR